MCQRDPFINKCASVQKTEVTLADIDALVRDINRESYLFDRQINQIDQINFNKRIRLLEYIILVLEVVLVVEIVVLAVVIFECATVKSTVLGNALNGVPEESGPIDNSRYGNPDKAKLESYNLFTEAKELFQKSINIVQLRIKKLRAKLIQLDEDAERTTIIDEINDLNDLLPGLTSKIEELIKLIKEAIINNQISTKEKLKQYQQTMKIIPIRKNKIKRRNLNNKH